MTTKRIHRPVSREQRYTSDRPCPTCGGWQDKGSNHCTGYLASNGGNWCSRVPSDRVATNAADTVYWHPSSSRNGHDPVTPIPRKTEKGKVIARYIYEEAEPPIRVNRWHPKRFTQDHWDGERWVSGLAPDQKHAPYHLARVLEGIKDGKRIYIAEGEKDVEAIEAAGGVATCNPMGALKWDDAFSRYFVGAEVFVISDKDENGRTHAHRVRRSLERAGGRASIVQARTGKDASDHLASGHALDEFDPTPPRFERTDLSAVEAKIPDLIVPRLVYRGCVTSIYGPTGAAKTLIAQGILLILLRLGMTPGHWDHEMGGAPIAARYRAMGATTSDLRKIAYYEFPELTLDAAEEFVEQVIADDCDCVLIDPTADFLGIAGLDENANADYTQWATATTQRLTQHGIATITLDGAPHDATHQRGASQKGYKASLAFAVEVKKEPKRDQIGEVHLTCTKDRYGEVGKGTVLVFRVGGDGAGRIVVERVDDAEVEDRQAEHDRHVRALARHAEMTLKANGATDGASALTTNQTTELMGPGTATIKREALVLAAADPTFKVASAPGQGKAVMYWYAATRHVGASE